MSEAPPAATPAPSRIAAFVALALSFGVIAFTSRPPEPKPLDAPAGEFSGSRARQIHQRLFEGVGAHPIGSAAHGVMRQRVVDELTALGFASEIQEVFACNPAPVCATVRNVLARHQGQHRGGAVLVSTHYDSVAAGPGASDAGASVAAVLELARALKASPTLERDVVLLIDDGEEAGLLGAEGFLSHPWFSEIGAVVNLEARGTEGASYWFETARGNATVVGVVAPRLPSPATSSTFIEIYRRMPNDTDFSVWRRAGLQGVNLAFIGGGERYHTPLDDLAHSSPASLEHQGRNALAAVRALAERPGTESIRAVEDVVFFDVAGLFVARWPVAVGYVLGALALFGTAIAARRFPAPPTLGASLAGLAMAIAAPLAAGLFAEGARRILVATGAAPRPWIASSRPLLIAIWVLAFSGVALAAWLFARRSGAAGSWWGTWTWMSLIGLVLVAKVPGASYLFLVPALVAVSVSLVRGKPSAALAAFAAGILWWSLATDLYGALGVPLIAVTGAVVGLIVATTLPAWASPGRFVKGGLVAIALAVAIAAIALLGVLPHATAERPERLNFQAFQDSGLMPLIYATPESGELPVETRAVANWTRVEGKPFPWSARPAGPRGPWSTSLDGQASLAEPPLAEILGQEPVRLDDGSDARRVRLRIASARSAPGLTLMAPPGGVWRELSVNGVRPPVEGVADLSDTTSWRPLSILAGPEGGSVIEFVLPGLQPVEFVLFDRSRELPNAAEPILRSRPPRAVQSGSGDGWIVATRVVL